MHAADGLRALLERVAGRRLRRHRRRLGHAVADGHLVHVHPLDHLLHDLDRARRAGHDPGPQAGEVVLLEVGVVELGDEHRRDAVEARAALLLDGRQHGGRLERRLGDDHRRAVGGAAEIAHHHPEAVVEGHRDADPVVLVVAAALADEEGVVEDVVVAERGALGEARGAARVLDVDRVVGIERRRVRLRAVALEQRVPLGRAEQHDALELRQVAADLLDHRGVVAGLEGARGDQHAAARLAQRVLELGRAVRRVDVDEDDPRLGGGELDEHPLGAVGRPDADPVPLLEPGAEQSARERVDLLVELGVAEAHALVAHDQRLAVAEAGDRALEVLADRLADQRLGCDARRVGTSHGVNRTPTWAPPSARRSASGRPRTRSRRCR